MVGLTAIEAKETPDPILNSEVKLSFVYFGTALREGVGKSKAVNPTFSPPASFQERLVAQCFN